MLDELKELQQALEPESELSRKVLDLQRALLVAVTSEEDEVKRERVCGWVGGRGWVSRGGSACGGGVVCFGVMV
jgi:hypothetical protein